MCNVCEWFLLLHLNISVPLPLLQYLLLKSLLVIHVNAEYTYICDQTRIGYNILQILI